MPFKTTYREHKGRVFKRVQTHLPAVKVRAWAQYSLNWRQPESGRTPEENRWARARTNDVWSIWHDGNWRYCFANVKREHLKKWLDYYAARY